MDWPFREDDPALFNTKEECIEWWLNSARNSYRQSKGRMEYYKFAMESAAKKIEYFEGLL